MSTLTAHQTEVFQQELYVAAQNKGGFVRDRVRRKTGIIGYRTHFPKISAAGAAQPKTQAGKVPLLDIARTRVFCDLADFYGADWIDDLDELITNVPQREATQNLIAYSLGRREDDLMTTAAVGSANAFNNTASDDSFASDAIPRQILQTFGDNEIMDQEGMFAAVKWKTWNDLLALNSFINSQYGGKVELTSEGQLPKMYFGFAYTPWSRLPTHASGSKLNLWWNMKCLAAATGQEITMTIERLAEYDTWQVMGKMKEGAVLIDDTGVIQRRYG